MVDEKSYYNRDSITGVSSDSSYKLYQFWNIIYFYGIIYESRGVLHEEPHNKRNSFTQESYRFIQI